MEDQIDTADNLNEDKAAVQAKSSIKMRVWNIACYILFAAGIAFFVFYIIGSQHVPVINYAGLIVISVIAALLTIYLCYKTSLIKIGIARIAALLIAGVLLAGNWFIYFRYLPKYGPFDACAVVKAAPEYAFANIIPHILVIPVSNNQYFSQIGYYLIEDNPFCDTGYILDVIYDKKVTACINFNSVTGKYESCAPLDPIMH